jgi:hypothetical protein
VLYLKAGTVLDYQSNPVLDVTVAVDDTTIPGTPDSTAALAISVTPAGASQTVTFQQRVNGYTGTLDTDVWGDAPNNQYSTSTFVRVDGRSTNYPAHALLQFANLFGSGPGQIPVGAQITSAKLEITVTDDGDAVKLCMLRWVAAEREHLGGIRRTMLSGQHGRSSTGYVVRVSSIDVTTSLLAWANAPLTNFGWAILQGTNKVQFDSSEGTTPPKLTVTFIASSGNKAPTVALANTTTSLAENASTTPRLKVADIVVTDDALGVNNLSLSGADAALFEIAGFELYLKAGTILDYETNPVLDVTVAVDDATVGGTPDSMTALAIAVTDVNENPTDIALSNASVAENPAGRRWGAPRADRIVATRSPTGLVNWTGGHRDNGLFTISGNQLQTAASFNYKAQNSYAYPPAVRRTRGLVTGEGLHDRRHGRE